MINCHVFHMQPCSALCDDMAKIRIYAKLLIKIRKLDMLAPLITDPSPSSFATLSNKNCHTWYVTYDMWQVWAGEHSLKISAPYISRFGSEGVLEIWVTDFINQCVTKVFVEQPRIHRVHITCVNNLQTSLVGKL